MRGLLLKDWYMMKKYCLVCFVVAAVCFAAFLINDSDTYFYYFVFLPCLLCGMIPSTLLSYDENSRWMQYSGTLPYTEAQIVSAKYLIGLFVQIALLVATGLAQAIKMGINSNFIFKDFILCMWPILITASLINSILLPSIFKLGVENGRIVYFIVAGIIIGASSLLRTPFLDEHAITVLLTVLSFIGIGGYIFSWYLSIVFYKQRTIA